MHVCNEADLHALIMGCREMADLFHQRVKVGHGPSAMRVAAGGAMQLRRAANFLEMIGKGYPELIEQPEVNSDPATAGVH